MAEQNTEKETPPKEESLGEYLSRIRKGKDINLKNIAFSTKINYEILSSLEKDELEHLPNKTYLLGFVRCFAKEIGADEDHAISLLREQLPVSPSSKESIISSMENNNLLKLNKIKTEHRKHSVATIFFLLALTAIVGGLIFFSQESTQSITAKNKEKFKEIKVKHTTTMNKGIPKVEPNQIPQSDFKKNDENKKTDSENIKNSTKINLSQRLVKTSIGELKLTKMSYPLYTLDKNHPSLKDPSIYPLRAQKSGNSKDEKVFIRASHGDSWVAYRTPGRYIKSFVLKKEETLLIKGKFIELVVGNLGAIEIFYNNQYLITESKTGIKSLVFPHKRAKNMETPIFFYDKENNRYYRTDELVNNKQ